MRRQAPGPPGALFFLWRPRSHHRFVMFPDPIVTTLPVPLCHPIFRDARKDVAVAGRVGRFCGAEALV